MVDDQPARLLSYEAILSGLGVECVRALSGRQALERLLKQSFAVILLDVSMPEMDGFETARLIRQHPRYERTPIIFITGVHVSELDQLKGYELGAIDYIAVPVVPEVLRSKVAVLVELHQRRSELERLNLTLAATREELRAQHAESERRLLAIIENVPVGVAFADMSGRFQYVNRAWCDLLGYSAEELRTLSWTDITHPDEIEYDRAQAARVASGELSHYLLEKRYVRKDGSVVWVNLYGNFVLDDAGRPIQGVGVCIDVTGRHLEERRRDEFLAMLAHELRNPMAPIRNAAEVLAQRLGRDARTQPLTDILKRQTTQLSRLLDDLLDVARLTHGRIELHREILPVATCIELAIEAAGPLIRERRHRLTVTQTLQPLSVNADRTRLVQCLSNLLTNAAHYTEPGGDIAIRAQARDGKAVIEVADTGAGLSAELLPRVFDPFVQGERSLDRAQGGLGIGLSLCRRLIEMHGGGVSAQSEGLGRGSVFRLELPLAPEHADAAAATAQASPGAKRRILVVDDNRDSADTLAMLLTAEGHSLRTAYSAESALEQCAAFHPEVVLLDIGLPRISGYELAGRLLAQDRSMRLIALTGYGQAEDRSRSAAAGFRGHLVKPVDLRELDSYLAQ